MKRFSGAAARDKPRTLRSRFLAIVLVLYVIPVGMVGGWFRQQLVNLFWSEYSEAAVQTSRQIAQEMEYRLELYEVMVTGISTNEELYNRLTRSYQDMHSQWDTTSFIRRSFSYAYDMLPGVADIRLYHDNQSMVETGGLLWRVSDRALGDETERTWYRRVTRRYAFEWRLEDADGPAPMLTLACRIGVAGESAPGAVYIRIAAKEALGGMLEDTQNEYVLMDENGGIVMATPGGIEAMEAEYTGGRRHGEDAVIYENAIVTRQPIARSFTLMGYIPVEEMSRRYSQLSNAFMGGFVILAGLGLLLALMLLNNLDRRFRRLRSRLSEMAGGELNVSLPVDRHDELAAVEKQFNEMVVRIQQLMCEVETQRIREMEDKIRALELYINPHFLYNTLGLIRWHALDAGDAQLVKLVDNMTTYYRLSLSEGKSVVPVEKELMHLEAYVNIQQLRYGGVIEVDIDYDEEALYAWTPKNILQTIVENSYIHGQITGGGGRIRVQARTDGDSIRFIIEDNGVGMSPGQLEILRSDDPEVNKGIGVRSVRQRLKLFFGDQTGMNIECGEEGGTRVEIVIPYCAEIPQVPGGRYV